MFTAIRNAFTQYPKIIPELNQANPVAMHTPDVLFLEQKEYQLVFLYCDRQTTHSRAVGNSEHLWNASTPGKYTMWVHQLHKESYPIALPQLREYGRVPHLPIRGEVVKIETHRLIELDREKANRVQFKRIKVPVDIHLYMLSETKERSNLYQAHGIPYRRDGYPIPVVYTIEAWMYVGRPKHWVDIIDGGAIFRQGKIIQTNKMKKVDEFGYEGKSYIFDPSQYEQHT